IASGSSMMAAMSVAASTVTTLVVGEADVDFARTGGARSAAARAVSSATEAIFEPGLRRRPLRAQHRVERRVADAAVGSDLVRAQHAVEARAEPQDRRRVAAERRHD